MRAMAGEQVVTGTVIGDRGVPIAGYVKLGASGARRAIATSVTLRADDGHELELVELATATIEPVATRRAAWQDLEREPGSSLLVDDAPAPDVEVEVSAALLRGGERIAAWGEVREHVFEGDGTGDVYRAGATRRVRVVAPALVVVGAHALERLDKLRARRATPPTPTAARRVETPTPTPPKPKPAPKRRGPWHQRPAVSLGVWCAIPLIVLLGVGALVGGPPLRPVAAALGGAALGGAAGPRRDDVAELSRPPRSRPRRRTPRRSSRAYGERGTGGRRSRARQRRPSTPSPASRRTEST